MGKGRLRVGGCCARAHDRHPCALVTTLWALPTRRIFRTLVCWDKKARRNFSGGQCRFRCGRCLNARSHAACAGRGSPLYIEEGAAPGM